MNKKWVGILFLIFFCTLSISHAQKVELIDLEKVTTLKRIELVKSLEITYATGLHLSPMVEKSDEERDGYKIVNLLNQVKYEYYFQGDQLKKLHITEVYRNPNVTFQNEKDLLKLLSLSSDQAQITPASRILLQKELEGYIYSDSYLNGKLDGIIKSPPKGSYIEFDSDQYKIRYWILGKLIQMIEIQVK